MCNMIFIWIYFWRCLLLLPVWSCLFLKNDLLMPSVVSVAAFLSHSMLFLRVSQLLWELTEIDTLRICRMARAVYAHMWLKYKPTQCTWIYGNPRVRQAYCKARICRSPGCGSAPALAIFFFFFLSRQAEWERCEINWDMKQQRNNVNITGRIPAVRQVGYRQSGPGARFAFRGFWGARMKLKSKRNELKCGGKFCARRGPRCCTDGSSKGCGEQSKATNGSNGRVFTGNS